MSDSLGFAHFLYNADAIAWIVLGLLIAMSVGSWYLIAAKTVQTLLQRRRSSSFLHVFRQESSLAAIVQRLRSSEARDPFTRLVHHSLDAIDRYRASSEVARLVDAGTSEDFVTRAMKNAIAQDLVRLERGQTFLATVASTAPFVGLFGTVWGIHHALMAIGRSGEAGLDAVAAPVGEALIMTGIGLAVAIPAAAAYNAFARVRRNTRSDLESFACDLLALMGTGVASMRLADRPPTSDRIPGRAREPAGAAVSAGGR